MADGPHCNTYPLFLALPSARTVLAWTREVQLNKQFISLANCICSVSLESAADWLQMQRRPQAEAESQDPLVRFPLPWAGKSSSQRLLTRLVPMATAEQVCSLTSPSPRRPSGERRENQQVLRQDQPTTRRCYLWFRRVFCFL